MRYSCLLCRPVTLVTSVFLAQVTSQCQSWHGSQTQVTPLPHYPITPLPHYPITPFTPLLHYSITPLLHYSITPLLQFPKLLHRYTVQPAELHITLLI